MIYYSDIVQNENGDVISGAVVTVRDYYTSAVQTLYSDNGVTPIGSSTTTDLYGKFQFYINSGIYSITVTGTGVINSSDQPVYINTTVQYGNIRDQGAVGNGVIDDRAAFVKADALGSFIVPKSTGAYVVASNLTISSAMSIMDGAQISISAGATLTINGQLDAPHQKIFTGLGNVVFGKNIVRAYPEWFGAAPDVYIGGTDFPAIQKCVTACAANRVTTYLGQNYFGTPAGVAVTLTNATPIECKPGIVINGLGQQQGFIFDSGNYGGMKFNFPTMYSFNAFCFKLKGANYVDLNIESIASCPGDGVVLETLSASYNHCLDNKITCHLVSNSRAAFVFSAGNGSGINQAVMQGNEIYCNFVVQCDKALLFYMAATGSTPAWDSNKAVFQAIDPANKAGAIGLSNTTAQIVPRLIFKCETWMGGFPATGGVWMAGLFNGLEAYFGVASNLQSYSEVAINGQGNSYKTLGSGSNINTASYVASSVANARASFNGGLPISDTRYALTYTLATNVLANELLTLYCYSPWVDSGSNRINVQNINFTGLIPEVVTRGANANEIAIILRNVSGATVNSGTTVQLYVEVG